MPDSLKLASPFVWVRLKEQRVLTFYLWGTGFVISVTLSMYLLAKATQTLPIGTAYPIWTGIGAVGTVLVGILFFHEPATLGRLFFMTTLILSIIGLKLI